MNIKTGKGLFPFIVLLQLFVVAMTDQSALPVTNRFIQASNHTVPQYLEENQGRWEGAYYFIFGTDPQPGLINQIRLEGKGDKWAEEERRVKEIVLVVNRMTPQPKFMCLGGDILNAFPGKDYRKHQYNAMQTAFSGLNTNIPIFIVSGNHDVGNVPTNESRDIFNEEFGDEYYSFWVAGVFYIVLDSQYLFDDSMTLERSAAQEKWFDSVLKKAAVCGSQHVVLFMHIPIFLKSIDEDDTYFSIKRSDRVKLLNRLADARINKVFSGHYHRTAGGTWTRSNSDGTQHTIEITVSSAIGCQLGDQQPGINVVKVLDSDIQHTYYPITQIPTTVNL